MLAQHRGGPRQAKSTQTRQPHYATSDFRFPRPLQQAGSGSRKPIKNRALGPIKKRDPAQRTQAPASCVSATIRSFSSRPHRRRRSRPPMISTTPCDIALSSTLQSALRSALQHRHRKAVLTGRLPRSVRVQEWCALPDPTAGSRFECPDSTQSGHRWRLRSPPVSGAFAPLGKAIPGPASRRAGS